MGDPGPLDHHACSLVGLDRVVQTYFAAFPPLPKRYTIGGSAPSFSDSPLRKDF